MRTIAALVVVLAFGAALVACEDTGKDNGGSATSTPAASNTPGATSPATTPIPTVEGEPTVTSSGLQIYEITAGTGQEASATDTITAHYTGWLEDGTMFSTSYGGTPPQFSLAGGVIQGWTEGVPGMKVGGKRRLVIPSDLAYGAEGRPGTIPPNAALTFDIELVSIP